MENQIINTRNEAIAQISLATSIGDLEELRVVYLGKNGRISNLIKNIREVSSQDRKKVGLLLNETKNIILATISEKKNSLLDSSRVWFDPTVPGVPPKTGHLHLITHAINEIAQVFEKLGFERVRYPEVEWDWYAFESLNMEKGHPARDDWETFFIEANINSKLGAIILTPHTSSGQVRELKRVKNPPIRMINIAKCYRRQSDVSHVPMFHQFEGLVVGKNISVSNLKGTLDYFAKNFFGSERETRLRPYHFQFTEPSFEVDISCGVCSGKGCKLCKSGWLELGGAGMVHPVVLKNGGIDPNKYRGFAFGWGVERVMMMKSGLEISDIRQIYGTDLRFLTQF